MNKIPLSLVALAAVGTPLTAQAVTYTEFEAFASGWIKIISGYSNPNASSFSSEIQNIINEATAAQGTTSEFSEYESRVTTIAAAAEEAEKPYTANTNLSNALTELNKKLNDANVAYAALDDKTGAPDDNHKSDDTYKTYKIERLKDTKATAKNIEEQLKGFRSLTSDGKTKVDASILDSEASISAAIKEAAAYVDGEAKDLQAKQTNYIANLNAKYAVADAVQDALVNTYNKAVTDISDKFNDAKFSTWLNAATDPSKGELAYAHNKLQEVIQKNDAPLTETASVDDKGVPNKDSHAGMQAEYQRMITEAISSIGDVRDKYIDGDNSLLGLYNAANAKISLLENGKTENGTVTVIGFNTLKKSITEAGLTETYQKDLDAITASIAALKATVEGGLAVTPPDPAVFNISADADAVRKAIDALDEKAGNAVDNYNHYQAVLDALKPYQTALDNAVKTAKTLSNDKNYDAARYFEATQASIQTLITDEQNAAKKAFDDAAATGTVNTYAIQKGDEITQKTTDYAANTVAALKQYNALDKSLESLETPLKNVSTVAAENTAVVAYSVKDDGSLTYKNIIDALQNEINRVNAAITTACTKEGDAHLTELNKIGVNAPDYLADLATVTADTYKEDKAKYESLSAIEAATAMYNRTNNDLTSLETAYSGLILTNADAVYGKDAKAITDAANAAQTTISTLKTEISNRYNAFNTESEEVKKLELARSLSAYIASLNDQINKLRTDLDALTEKAKAATENKAAYDELTAKLGVVSSAVNTSTQAVNDYKYLYDQTANNTKDDEGKKYYLNLLVSYNKQLLGDDQTLNGVGGHDGTIADAYNAGTAAADKAKLLSTLNTLLTTVNAVPADAKTNNNNKGTQDLSVEGLEEKWDNTYNTILKYDQSLAATDYLKQLQAINNNDIKNLKAAIEDYYAKGQSAEKKTEVSKEVARIKSAIEEIAKTQEDNYDSQMELTNANNHQLFLNTYNSATTMFVNAVDTLGMFSGITNPDLKQFIDENGELTKTHDDIYKYADSLRTIKSAEADAYEKHMAATPTNLFEPDEYVNTAAGYRAKLAELIANYRSTVNDKAYTLCSGYINNAEILLNSAAQELKDFGYAEEVVGKLENGSLSNIRKTAYPALDVAVSEAVAAAGSSRNDMSTLFAVTLDKHLNVLQNIMYGTAIAEQNEVIAANEWNFRYAQINAIIADELAKAAEFVETPNVGQDRINTVKTWLSGNDYQYSDITAPQAVKNAKVSYDNLRGANLYNNLRNGGSGILDVLEGNLGLYTPTTQPNDPTKIIEANHTYKYATLWNDLNADGHIDEVCQQILAEVAKAQAELDEVAEVINQLYAAHDVTTQTAKDLAAIQEKLDEYVEAANADKQVYAWYNSKLTDFKSYYKNVFPGEINLLNQAVGDELDALVKEIKALEEDYNKAVAALGGDLSAIAAYEKTIDDLMADHQKLATTWSTSTDKDADALLPDLLALEAEIAKVNKELVAIYDDAKGTDTPAEIKSDLEEAYAPIDKALADYAAWVEEFPQLSKNDFLINSVADAIAAVKEDIAAKEADGTLPFYADNLTNDINAVTNKLNDALNTSKGINNHIDKYGIKRELSLNAYHNILVANKAAYEKLTAGIADYQADLNKVLAAVKEYNHANFMVEDPAGDYDSRDKNASLIQDKIDDSKAIIEFLYKNENLDSNNTIPNEDDIKRLIASLFADASNAEANAYMDVLWNLNGRNTDYNWYEKLENESVTDILYGYYLKNLSTQRYDYHKPLVYTPSTFALLQATHGDVLDALDNLYDFCWFSYNQKRIWNDVNGNAVYDKDGRQPVSIDYRTEAWPIIEAKLAELDAKIKELRKDAKEDNIIRGDADGNKRVNVNDWSMIRTWIVDRVELEDITDEVRRYSADINEDGSLTITDLVQVANEAFANDNTEVVPNVPAAIKARVQSRVPVQSDDAITLAAVSEETSVFGKNIRLAVNLDNTVDYVAFQMDVKLPAGMTLTGESLTERANGHELVSSDLNGTHRVVVATPENNAFLNDGNAVLYLDVQVGGDYNGGDVEISNIIFSDAQARSYNLNGVSTNNPTGIGSITAPTVSERIYSVGGQVMKAVKKGVNIIKGTDGSTKKVIKK